MFFYHTLILFLFAVITQVTAHGYVSKVSIDGQDYAGNVPNQTPSTPLAPPHTENLFADE